MAKLTDNARELGFKADSVCVVASYAPRHYLDDYREGVKLIVYNLNRAGTTLDHFGVILSHKDAIELLSQLDTALRQYDKRQAAVDQGD